MYKFSIANSVSSRTQVVDRRVFEEALDNPKVAMICQQIAQIVAQMTGCTDEAAKRALQDKMSSLKRGLPGFCWHAAEFKEGKRNAFSAVPSDLTMIDVDHVNEPQKLYESIREAALAMGLVAAHVTPSTFGLRLIFVRAKDVAIEQHQAWITEQLQLKGVDGCTKDLPRLSFVVPRRYWLYVDYDALFEGKTVACNSVAPSGLNSGERPVTQGSHPVLGYVAPSGLNSGERPVTQGSHPVLGYVAPSGLEQMSVYEETYKGVPYTAIVEALESLYGGKPEHGSRNTQIFSMACMLRSICNDDPNWIAKILPTYGENEQRWMATIRSACSRYQVRNIPNLMQKAIDMAGASAASPTPSPSPSGEGWSEAPPRMPEKLPKLIRHLIKNVPEVCRPSVACGVFPALATHLADVNFRLIDGTKKEATFMCVNMARQSSGKASVNKPIEYIMADIKERDDINRRREQEWKDAVGSKGSNKEKPKRPDDLCVQMLVTDMTNAAFVQRLKDAGSKYIYTNLEELDLLKQLQTNGTRDVGKIICLCFDNGTYGQERVGLQSITALLPLRWNWNASSTIEKGRDFFHNRLIDGTLSRVNFCTIISDDSKEFKYGDYDEQYAAELKPFITNLNLCKGEVSCPQALTMAKRLQQKCTEIALQTENVIYQEFAYRAVTIAYMKAMVLYIANDMTWEKSIDEFCEWSLDYDLWCKNYFFGEAIMAAREAARPKRQYGKGNMLNLLPDNFSITEAEDVRKKNNKAAEGTQHMLSVWMHRGYITLNHETQKYEKTDKYKLKR